MGAVTGREKLAARQQFLLENEGAKIVLEKQTIDQIACAFISSLKES